MKTYRAAVIGCSRMGAFIDNEVPDYEAIKLPYSHAAGFFAEERTDLNRMCGSPSRSHGTFWKPIQCPKSESIHRLP